MKKFTLNEIVNLFRQYNRENNIKFGEATKTPYLKAVIVYSQSNFKQQYTEVQRSYRIESDGGKIFFDDMLGRSMWGDCLDGIDKNVRLDYYNWKVDYCYLEN